MTPPPKQRLAEGAALFDAGEFFAAHEVWEAAWKAARGPSRGLLQALIQTAAALHQAQRGKRSGAQRLLTRALAGLKQQPSQWAGLDVEGFAERLRAWAAAFPEFPAAAWAEGLRPQLGAEQGWDPTEDAGHPSQCPYCGEPVEVHAEAVGPSEEVYVEDCPVCCRPWSVAVSRVGASVQVTLGRESD